MKSRNDIADIYMCNVTSANGCVRQICYNRNNPRKSTILQFGVACIAK